MLGELSGALAHELNQPLAAILSNAQAAQRYLARPEIDRAEIAEILQDIVDSNRHASEVIESLRQLLKKGETPRQTLEINELVQYVLKLLRVDLASHDIAIETNLAAGLPGIYGDRVQLHQVLLNLVVNASDAMREVPGKRWLSVTTKLGDSNGVIVSVRDCGPGIPADALAKIFEPFFTTKAQGLGLGLSVSRSIILTHSGTLTAANPPEGGAAFHITLPAENAAAVA